MNEIWLAGVSGAVLVTLLALQVTLSIHLARLHEVGRENAGDASSSSRSKDLRTGGPLAAALTVCFFIYMAYALLPIRLRHACIAGIVFSAAHLIGAFLLYPHYPSVAHVSPTTVLADFAYLRFFKIFSHIKLEKACILSNFLKYKSLIEY